MLTMDHCSGKPDEQATTFGDLSRSELMRRIRSSGNKTTELALISLLRKAGLGGWRRHLPLPGKPDFAWRARKVAVFVDGCFWHGHNCGKNVTPVTNAVMWREKIEGNRRRDRRVASQLRAKGWSVIRIWECRLRQAPERCVKRIAQKLKEPR